MMELLRVRPPFYNWESEMTKEPDINHVPTTQDQESHELRKTSGRGLVVGICLFAMAIALLVVGELAYHAK